jgi:uncharacterized protein (TIGR03067 family)
MVFRRPWPLLILILLCPFHGATGATRDVPELKIRDVDLLQGAWTVVSWEEAGRKQDPKGYKFAVKGQRILMNFGEHDLEYPFTVRQVKDAPKEIDVIDDRNYLLRGIYKLEGDNLTICLGLAARRPPAFAAPKAGDCCLVVLRRMNESKGRR